MTTEAWTITPEYTVAGIGPYAIQHPYAEGAISAFVLIDGLRTALTLADITVSPASSNTLGNLFLTPTAAATHAGRKLIIDRVTPDEQGWLGVQGERETGLEVQLDRTVQGLQEVRANAAGAIRIRGLLDAFDWADGTVPLRSGARVISGPTAADIANAQTFSTEAAASAASAAASAAAAEGSVPALTITSAAAFETSPLTYAQVAAGESIVTVAEGFSFLVVAAGAAVFDRINGNGVKVLARRLANGAFAAEAVAPWTDANAGQNALIAHANRNGSASVGVAPLAYVYTAASYDLRAGTRTALVVASVRFYSERLSVLRLRDAPFLLLGSAGVMTDVTEVSGFAPETFDVPIRKVSRVTGATQANPVSVTAPGHGFATNEKVRIFDNVGMTQINDTPYAITVTGANTFTLNGINGTGFTAFSGVAEVRPETDAALVTAINASRVFISDIIPRRLTHIFKAICPAGCGTSGIHITDCQVYGHESYDWIALHTRLATFGAGLLVDNTSGFPSNVATNPVIVPRPITGATRANPVVITCPTHGFTTGDNIRLCKVGGMTQIDSADFTITVINANSFSLNGINGTAYTAYTSGGWAVELHSSQPFDTGLVLINGKWDTAKLQNCLVQHYAWLWRLRSSGVITFVWEDGCTFDYGGKGRYQIELDGSSVANIQAIGGWHWTLDQDFLQIQKPNPAAAFVSNTSIRGMDISTGGCVLRDSLGVVASAEFTDIRLGFLGRARQFLALGFTVGGNADLTLKNVSFPNPDNFYGAGSAAFFEPDYGFYVDSTETNVSFNVSDCTLRGTTAAFSVPTSPVAVGPRDRVVANNRQGNGTLPGYVQTVAATMPASGVAVANNNGMTMEVFLDGGTITSIAKNGVTFKTGTGSENFKVGRGETWSCVYTVAPTLRYSFGDS